MICILILDYFVKKSRRGQDILMKHGYMDMYESK